jgi:transcriptional regulator with XRE-family HTH domain
MATMLINRDALVAIRTGSGVGLVELANRAGITREGLRKIERGLVERPHPNTVRALAKALNVPVEAIVLAESARAS